LIFDEIDTGISGEAAKQVGYIMKDLAANRQIICITHQPQIAARAHTHYFIYKTTVDKKIQTRIKILNNKERIETIARMLSGEKLSTTSLQVAEEMLQE
ncbi:MAG TPA: DNA repair protein RecN, partial [Chitinophagaceae bacterium]|nr:DNA repair protein RecN [Chitinophagaceae bacterium]